MKAMMMVKTATELLVTGMVMVIMIVMMMIGW